MPAPARFARSWALRRAAAFTAILLGPAAARATDVDPSLPAILVVGPSPGFCPMARIDAQRRGRSPSALPRRPKVLWRRTVRGGLDAAPLVVDPRGAVIAASARAPELLQLAADGTEMWRRTTGVGPSIAGVVLLNDATRFVVTSAGEGWGFSADGSLRFRTSLDLLERTARVGMLPLEDGGIAVAAGSEIIELDGDGRPRQRLRLPERIQGPLIAARSGLVATTQSGTVYLIGAGFAARVGELGGDPGEAGASSPDGVHLFAAVDAQRLLVFDLARRTAETRFTLSDRSLAGPVVFGQNDTLVTMTTNGVLLRWTKAASTPDRTPLEPRAVTSTPDAGRVDAPLADDTPAPLPDSEGRIAFARAGGRVGIMAADGAIRMMDDVVCASPVALAPAGLHRMVLACRTGSILMLADDVP